MQAVFLCEFQLNHPFPSVVHFNLYAIFMLRIPPLLQAGCLHEMHQRVVVAFADRQVLPQVERGFSDDWFEELQIHGMQVGMGVSVDMPECLESLQLCEVYSDKL